MDGLGCFAASSQHTLEMEQAAGIDGSYKFGSSGRNALDLGIAHGNRNIGELRGKSPAESAAFLRARQFQEFESLHLAQKLQRFVAQAQFS